MTYPGNHQTKAMAVLKTWAKRCDKVVFFSTEPSPSLPVIAINISSERRHLTFKMRQAMDYLYQNHVHDADWFLKADDDTYVIMENLRRFLESKDPAFPAMYGRHYYHPSNGLYLSGGPGYVLSRKALGLLGSRDPDTCAMDTHDGVSDDVRLSMCLAQIGVKVEKSYDDSGRTMFHHFTPDT